MSSILKKALQHWHKVFGSTSQQTHYDKEALDALRSLGYM
jgi:hypothetical protein